MPLVRLNVRTVLRGTKTINPAAQEKAIIYNELVSNAVAVQTVADQTQALHTLHSRGIAISAADLAHFSLYPMGRVNRFGVYPARIKTDSGLPNRHLPAAPDSPDARAA